MGSEGSVGTEQANLADFISVSEMVFSKQQTNFSVLEGLSESMSHILSCITELSWRE